MRAAALKGGIVEWLAGGLPVDTKDAPKQAAPQTRRPERLMDMRYRVLAGLLLVCSALLPLEAQTQSPTELAQALQKKYRAIRDFSTDSSHTYRGGVLKKSITEKGRLLIGEGHMRWNYTSPEVKQYRVGRREALLHRTSRPTSRSSSAPCRRTTPPVRRRCSSRARATSRATSRRRTATCPRGSAPGTRALKLVPRKPRPDYDWLVLLVDPGSLTLRGMVTADARVGTSVFSFSNLKENVGLADKEFTFRMPRGVDVITDGGGR